MLKMFAMQAQSSGRVVFNAIILAFPLSFFTFQVLKSAKSRMYEASWTKRSESANCSSPAGNTNSRRTDPNVILLFYGCTIMKRIINFS